MEYFINYPFHDFFKEILYLKIKINNTIYYFIIVYCSTYYNNVCYIRGS